jgi:hypothetical protein
MARRSGRYSGDSPVETLLKDAREFCRNMLPHDQEILRCDFLTTPWW